MLPPPIIPAKPRVRRKRRAVASAPTPGPVAIVSVTADALNGIVLFDAETITEVNNVSQLEIDFNGIWQPCDAIMEFTANTITLQCPVAIVPGMAWRVVFPMGVVWDNNPAITMNVPASGVVL